MLLAREEQDLLLHPAVAAGEIGQETGLLRLARAQHRAGIGKSGDPHRIPHQSAALRDLRGLACVFLRKRALWPCAGAASHKDRLRLIMIYYGS